MAKANGKTDGHLGLKHEDLEHELPAAETLDESGLQSSAANPPEVGAASEAEKLKAERDALLDRLARLQAEFDNARKRAVREQQDFREFAAADVIKNFLPALDSFERALKSGRGRHGLSQRSRSHLPSVSGCVAEKRSTTDCSGGAGFRPASSRGGGNGGHNRCPGPACGRRTAARLQVQGPVAAPRDGAGRAQRAGIEQAGFGLCPLRHPTAEPI